MSAQETGGLQLPTQAEREFFDLKPGSAQQVQNPEGGYCWPVDDLRRLHRILLLGTDKPMYRVQDEVACENINFITSLIQKSKGPDVVRFTKDVSVGRRHFKQGSVLLVLALCARSNDEKTKEAAYKAMPDICRIPTQLFMFLEFCQTSSGEGTGWGKAHKNAVCKWYHKFRTNPMKLAQLVTKYKGREGWSHNDVLRKAHPSPEKEDPGISLIMRFISKGMAPAVELYKSNSWANKPSVKQVMEYLHVCENVNKSESVEEVCSLAREHKLVWEQIPNAMLKHKEVWEAILPHMPTEALIRNLGKMSKLHLFPANSANEDLVVNKLNAIVPAKGANPEEDDSGEYPRQSCRIHPFRLLQAMKIYEGHHSYQERTSWVPNVRIQSTLEDVFYMSFKNVEASKKNFCLAIDVSSSMKGQMLDSVALSCIDAAAAVAMTLARTEENCYIIVFSSQAQSVDIQPDFSINEVSRAFNQVQLDPGHTDCTQPMKWAMEQKIKDIDTFVIFTDNLPDSGNVHPAEALRQYRKYSETHQAKMVVCGMKSNKFTIADPSDMDMLDIVGFDVDVPCIITEFAKGNI